MKKSTPSSYYVVTGGVDVNDLLDVTAVRW
jgi:hypothetical protein